MESAKQQLLVLLGSLPEELSPMDICHRLNELCYELYTCKQIAQRLTHYTEPRIHYPVIKAWADILGGGKTFPPPANEYSM